MQLRVYDVNIQLIVRYIKNYSGYSDQSPDLCARKMIGNIKMLSRYTPRKQNIHSRILVPIIL